VLVPPPKEKAKTLSKVGPVVFNRPIDHVIA